jgi:putative tryptophan/tyrosine transport system substrate-binding protein
MNKSIMALALCGMLFALSLPAEAQQPKKIPRIGWIAFSGSGPPRGFMIGLGELGYVDGQSIIIEYRSAQGRGERLAQIAAELVRLKPDVIVAPNYAATAAAQKATTTIPIVFTYGDPVGMGTVGSLAQPGKNLTGLDSFAFELAGKRLELLREAFPKISRVAVLLHADANNRRQLADMQNVAQSLGIQLQALEYRNVTVDFDSVFRRAINHRPDGLYVVANPLMRANQKRIVDLALKSRLPSMYYNTEFVDAGGLMAYGPDYRELNRRKAYYVDRILKGAKPVDLPVEQPTKFELVINLKTASELGLTISPDVLMWADRVIK